MSKSNIQLDIPQRQSFVAILMILWKTYRALFSQAIPVLIVALIGSGSAKGKFILIGLSILSILIMLYSVAAFFRYYFYLEGDKLVVEKGVFGRSKTIIPFDRIQTINFEQNIVHQIFSVLRLKVDTAGSAKKEFEFDAIGKDIANVLREKVLAHKAINPQTIIEEENEEIINSEIEYKPVLELELSDLIKVGLTTNHFRSTGLIILAILWIVETLNQAEIDVWDIAEQNNPFTYGVAIFAMAGISFFILSLIISLITTVLKNYGLIFYRSAQGFKLNAGLFTKKDTSAQDHKIQMVSWSDNILQKLIGIYDLHLKQASSVEVVNKKSITVPGCNKNHVSIVTDSLYGKDALDNIELHGVHKSFMWRRMFFLSLICIPVCLIAYVSFKPWIYIIAGLLFVFFIVSSIFRYHKCQYGFNDKMFYLRGGLFGDKVTILPLYKIQNVKLKRSPYQRRNDLANVEIFTAAGSITVPYAHYDKAVDMSNYLLYKVETSQEAWM